MTYLKTITVGTDKDYTTIGGAIEAVHNLIIAKTYHLDSIHRIKILIDAGSYNEWLNAWNPDSNIGYAIPRNGEMESVYPIPAAGYCIPSSVDLIATGGVVDIWHTNPYTQVSDNYGGVGVNCVNASTIMCMGWNYLEGLTIRATTYANKGVTGYSITSSLIYGSKIGTLHLHNCIVKGGHGDIKTIGTGLLKVTNCVVGRVTGEQSHDYSFGSRISGEKLDIRDTQLNATMQDAGDNAENVIGITGKGTGYIKNVTFSGTIAGADITGSERVIGIHVPITIENQKGRLVVDNFTMNITFTNLINSAYYLFSGVHIGQSWLEYPPRNYGAAFKLVLKNMNIAMNGIESNDDSGIKVFGVSLAEAVSVEVESGTFNLQRTGSSPDGHLSSFYKHPDAEGEIYVRQAVITNVTESDAIPMDLVPA